MQNKYLNHAHISESKFKEVLKLFCIGLEAKKVAELVSINRNTINRFFCFLEREFTNSVNNKAHLELEKLRLMNLILELKEFVVFVVEELLEKFQYLECLKEMAKFLLK